MWEGEIEEECRSLSSSQDFASSGFGPIEGQGLSDQDFVAFVSGSGMDSHRGG